MKPRFNPYIIGAPVKENSFYGREKLVNIVRDTLAITAVNLIVFFGQRRIGKTSLLQNLSNQETLQDFIFIYNDASELIDKPSYEVLYHFSWKIGQALDLPELSKTQLQNNENLFQTEFLTQAYEKIGYKRLVLLVDEFDIFERRRKTETANLKAKSALETFESLINNEPKLAFIVALGQGLEKLRSDLTRIIRTGHWARVSLLEPEDAQRLITEPARGQLSYLPEAETAILGLTAGHPYYTQLLCYEIFNELQFENGSQVRVSDVQKAAEKALETGTGGFGWLWEGLSPAEKIVASLLAETAEESPNHTVTEAQLSAAFDRHHIHRRGLELAEAPNRLIDLDIIERRGPTSYRYVVEIIRRWVYKKHPIFEEREQNLLRLNERASVEFAEGQLSTDPKVAARHYREVLAANPNHILAQLALAEIFLQQKQVNEAVEAYQAAYWLDQAKANTGLEKAKALQTQLQDRSKRVNRVLIGVIGVILLGCIVFTRLFSGGALITPGKAIATEGSIEVVSSPTVAAQVTPTQIESLTRELISTPTVLPTEEPTQELTPAPEPTETSTQEPIPTSSPTPTEESAQEPIETPTEEPTLQPTSEPTEDAIVEPPQPTPTPTLDPTPTPTPGYNAPSLISPESESFFTPSQEVILQWNEVDRLAEDEQYAVRLRFVENGVPKIEGHQVRTPSWIVPQTFLSRADGPERKYEWFVFIEKIAQGGANLQISPDSETRIFYWK